MSRTTAPLLGFDASGAIAKTLVYGKWRGVSYARRYIIPANPQTAGQTLTRSLFARLREMWKVNPTIGRAPWEAFATGRKFLGLNAFIGENVRVIRGDADMQDFIGSPGARGGLPPASVSITQSATTGAIDVLVTNPTIPTGWTFTAAQAVGFQDGDPVVDLVGDMVANEELVADTTFTLTGFPAATACVAAAWLKWTKPNGEIAYSVGTTAAVTSGA